MKKIINKSNRILTIDNITLLSKETKILDENIINMNKFSNLEQLGLISIFDYENNETPEDVIILDNNEFYAPVINTEPEIVEEVTEVKEKKTTKKKTAKTK